MEILYRDRDVVAIVKPVGTPAEPDPTGDPDALSLTCAVVGAPLWLVHRLDRVVGGVMVFAASARTAAALSAAIASGEMTKEYFAVVDTPIEPSGDYTDFLYKDARAGKAYPVDRARKGAKEARLSYRAVSQNGVYTLLRVTLHTGRFHQIRAQLAAHGHPLVGDGKYGSRDHGAHTPALFSAHVAFPASLSLARSDFSAVPDRTVYPFNLFDEKDYL